MLELTWLIRVNSYVAFPQLDKSVWFAANESAVLEDSLSYKPTMLMDLFVRTMYDVSESSIYQIGTILEMDAIDYRYPLVDMSYMKGSSYNFSETCNKIDVIYDPRCSITYSSLQSAGSSIVDNYMIYFENEKLNLFRKNSNGAMTQYSRIDSIKNLMKTYQDYTLFVSHYQGKWVLALDDNEYSSFDKQELWFVLYKDDIELSNAIKDEVVPFMENKTNTALNLKSQNIETLIGISPAIISTGNNINEETITVGIQILKTAVLSG